MARESIDNSVQLCVSRRAAHSPKEIVVPKGAFGVILFFAFCSYAYAQTFPEAREKWAFPIKITDVSVGGATYELVPSLTPDGRTMYIGRDSKIYFSSKTDSGWTIPVGLNDSINQPGTLTEAPSISPDGRTLYFRRYVGGWRLLQSKWNDSLHLWGTPRDMGFNINEYGGRYGMTPDNRHFYYQRNSLPRVSVWDDSIQNWGPSQWVDPFKTIDCYGGLCVTTNLRKMYYDSYLSDIDIYVHYYDTTAHQWSYPLSLNLCQMMDTLPAAHGTIQMYPWLSVDRKLLYFMSNFDGTLGIWVSRLVVDENGDTVLTSIAESSLPEDYVLEQNYPNPFNPVTTISYILPYRTMVQLRIYDLLGRQLALLVDEVQFQGRHNLQFNAEGLSSGVYFYSLITKDFVSRRKMLLIK